MPRNSEVIIFNKYETAICIAHKCSIQNPNMMEDSKKRDYVEFFLKNLCGVSMIVYLPTVITFNISLFLVTTIAEEDLLILGEDSSCDLEDEGGR